MKTIAPTLALFALTAALSACAGAIPAPTATPRPSATAAPTASPSPVPSPTAGSAVSSAAQAAALVFASDPHFGSLRPANADLIGGCCSFDANDDPPGYAVSISIGWGDCEAGCISHHTWLFHVDADGTITLANQQGDPDPPVPQGTAAKATVTLHLQAGPTCPVVANPPQPGCEPHPVANTNVVVHDPAGNVLATAKSGDKGDVQLELAAGAYYVVPDAVQGMMGQAHSVAFSVVGGETADVNIDYDTGIR